MLYVDSSGDIWAVENDTLAASAVARQLMYRVFASTDCSGPAYYSPSIGGNFIPPRVTFEVRGKTGARVRKDLAMLGHPGFCSADTGTGCQLTQPCPDSAAAILESDTIAVTPPTITAVLPLHPVFVGQ